MLDKNYWRFTLSLALVFSLFAASVPQTVVAQTAPQTQARADFQKALQTIEEKVEKRRAELGIPGISLVIVKDDRVIYMKGLGYKDFENKIAVTPDTQFAIGSATKAFTALSVLMSQDEGKLSLDDNPKKYLSYFKMHDPETDKNITVRDLLAHSSGLNRTDLAMITGKLNRQELIQVAGEAKPTAKLREKFQYQNLMYAAAGEVVATVQKTPWEVFVPERIFKPLGMTNSTMNVADMQKARDYSFGYSYNFDTEETRKLPTRDILQVAPAGSINSSARDMAQWLRFVLNGGTVGEKRLVSAKGFEEWLKPQQKIAGKTAYGLGWFLQEWNGLKVIQHGGNIDGFNSLVAMIPEKKLGFVLLTNVSGSPLGGDLMPLVWENILGNPNAPKTETPATAAPEKEVGKYRFEAAGFDIEVKMQDGKLVAVVPNQPLYTLENVGGRRYKLSGAPDGFFITFKEGELYLEQPQGNYTLPKTGDESRANQPDRDAAKELLGRYQSTDGKSIIEIKETGGKISLVVGQQPPYELRPREKDVFSPIPLSDSYSLKVKRTGEGKLEGVVLVQPEGEFTFNYLGAAAKSETPKMTVDEVMAKTIEAMGGEAGWRKLNSREMKFEIDFVNQGVRGYGTSWQKTPNLFASETTMTALNKPIATSFEYFDGKAGGDILSFAPAEAYTGQRLEDIKVENAFYGLLEWKTGLKSAEVTGTEKVGDEEAYKIVFRPEKASEYVYYISTKTFLPLRKSSVIVSSTSNRKLPVVSVFSDYRPVDGVLVPFRIVSTNQSMGELVTTVNEIKHNVAVPDSVFKPRIQITVPR